jgi:diguanylate cyclase (GGDEF)-like protein
MEIIKKKDTILLLANNEEIVTSIISSLNNKYTYISAVNSIEAFSKMTFNIPSLIIADIDIENVDVLNFLKTIRNGIKTKLIPFITISAMDNQSRRIKAIEYGVDAFVQYPFIVDELRAIVTSTLNRFKEFYLLTITDELTRLYNRKEFIKKFNDEIESEDQIELSLAILDIDHFKQINDNHGHQTGDMVLMKLASILKDKTNKHFFPARFGGEEFVVLFPSIKTAEATGMMKSLLQEFSSIVFSEGNKTFSVTFSAGLSEYPSMGSNISELLSRADQALYSAKNDGRNQIYSFNPIMARNDKFWEFLKTRKDIFIHDSIHESVTMLPYLPNLLDVITNLDFEVQSIGILIITVRSLIDYDSNIGYKNLFYDIENIKRIIQKSTELIFPSDTYIGLSDFYNYEFIILFPSVVDFHFNLIKFKEICKEISMTINESLKNFLSDISYSSDVTSLIQNNPRKIISDIDYARKNQNSLSDKSRLFTAYQKSFKNVSKLLSINNYLKLKTCYHCADLTPQYHYISLKKPFEYINLSNSILHEQIDTQKKLNDFIGLCQKAFHKKISKPLLFPLLMKIDTGYLIKYLSSIFPNTSLILMINEHYLSNSIIDIKSSVFDDLPENISLGIDNCYISNEILNILSMNNFSLLAFSDNTMRNVHLFKNRIKIINGLTIFLEQISVPTLAYNIQSDAEFQIANDLRINCCSGHYMDQFIKQNKL